MALGRKQLRRLLTAAFVQLYAARCNATSSTINTTLSVCDYTPENLYVVNATETSTGYVACVNATGSDAGLCEVCSCREKKVECVAGAVVAWVVCVGSGDATTCAASGQEYCGSNGSVDSTVGTLFLREGSSTYQDVSVGNAASGSSVSSSVDITNGSDSSAGSNSTSSASSTANVTSEPAIDYTPSTIDTSASLDTSISVDTSSPDTSTSVDTNINAHSSSTDITPGPVDSNIDAPSSSTDSSIGANSSSTGTNTSLDINTNAPSSGNDIAPGSVDSNIDTHSSSTDTNTSLDTNIDAHNSNTDTGTSVNTSIDADSSSTDIVSGSVDSSVGFDPEVAGSAVNEDNVISDVIGTVKPSPTNAAPSTDQNIIRPQAEGSTHQLDTNNGSSSDSSWSGGRLTVVLSAMCGIAVVAAIAVFVAVRKDQAKKNKELGTPMDDYTDDDSSMATPMTHGKRDIRYYGGGKRVVDSIDNTPLASIVVIGPGDDFLTPPAFASGQYRSYPRNASESGYARTDSTRAGNDRVLRDSQPSAAATAAATQQQLLISHGPSISDLPSPASDPIFDTSNTQVSFSSGLSSQYDSPPDERIYESEESFNSFRMVSATYSGTERDSDTSTNSSERQEDAADSTSSLSSLESAQYDVRDTEASEHVHESELNSNSSRVAMSFDIGSISPGV